MYAEVLVQYGSKSLDRTFTYKNGEVKCICNQFGYFKDSEFDPQFNAWKTFDGTKEIVL